MTQLRHPTSTRARLDDRARAWRRWIDHLRAGPLARLAGASGIVARDVAAHWRDAARETSARLLLAGVRERIVDGGPAGPGALRVELGDFEGQLELPLRRVAAFELHRADLSAALDPRIDDPLGIVARLAARMQLAGPDRARIEAEVLDSLTNLAQARLARALRDRVAADPERFAVAPDDPRLWDPEHFVTDGHPWHPTTRSRVGLTRAQVVRHAADQLGEAALACVDVAIDIARIAGDWREVAPEWFGAPAPGFVRVPVHPAARVKLGALFPELFAREAIRLVDRPALPCRSLLSLRTVALAPGRHLKLACPMLTTSARRVVSPMSVHNGPLVSKLIAAIQSSDPATAEGLTLMPEPAAAGLEPERVGPLAAELGAIVRVVPPLGEGERAWVCAAMGERWPGSDELVLERVAAGYPGGRPERIEALLAAWTAAIVPPSVRLFSIHGVALELHTQNTLARVAGGRLRGILVRDLGGIRLHGPRLRARHHAVPALAADSFIETDDLAEVRGKLEHTLFHSHLASLFEAAGALGLGIDEADCWARLRRLITDCYARWRTEPGASAELRRSLAADLDALTAPRVRAKALLRMRLHERSSDYEYTTVDNALAGSIELD